LRLGWGLVGSVTERVAAGVGSLERWVAWVEPIRRLGALPGGSALAGVPWDVASVGVITRARKGDVMRGSGSDGRKGGCVVRGSGEGTWGRGEEGSVDAGSVIVVWCLVVIVGVLRVSTGSVDVGRRHPYVEIDVVDRHCANR
jgi:hypothetical protein